MRRLAAAIFGLAALALTSLTAAAAPQGPPRNPELLARGEDADDGQARALRVARLRIDVAVRGGMAETTVTAHLANPGRNQLEGDFTLDLPAGSIVTGYALDVNGRMIPGVLQGQRRARVAFETRERRGIDPGLAEVRANAFRTRVSPVLAGTGRTARVSFVTPFDTDQPYRLPVNAPEAADRIDVAVRGADGVDVGGDLAGRLAAGPVGTRRMSLSGQPLAGVLQLRPRPGGPAQALLSRHSSGGLYFDVADVAPPRPVQGGRLRLYWDTSRSRRGDDHAAEIALVRHYASLARPSSVVLVELSDLAPHAAPLPTDPAALASALGRLTYRGGSSYAGLADPASAQADVCLLVSDGRPTLDPWRPRAMGCRLYAVSSSKGADGALLAAFAQASGGARLDLAARADPEALARAIRGRPAVVGAADGAGRRAAFLALPAPDGRFRIVGPAPPTVR